MLLHCYRVRLALADEFEEDRQEGQEAKPDRGQPRQGVKPLVHVGPELLKALVNVGPGLLKAPVAVAPQVIEALMDIIDPFGEFAFIHHDLHYTITTESGQVKCIRAWHCYRRRAGLLAMELTSAYRIPQQQPTHARLRSMTVQKLIDTIGPSRYFLETSDKGNSSK